MAAFRTSWDSHPNPDYGVWTTTNGGEILPGIISPLTATWFQRWDDAGMRQLLKPYPARRLIALHRAPVANFMGIFAGRLTLNVGFSVAAMSGLAPDIATAMAAQFFAGSDDAAGLILEPTARQQERSYAIAVAQRTAAPAHLVAERMRLLQARFSPGSATDRELSPRAGLQRLRELEPAVLDNFVRHLVVSTAAGEWQTRLAVLLAGHGADTGAVVPLCSGLGEVESSRPAIALYELARLADRSEVVRRALEERDALAFLTELDGEPARGWRGFARAFQSFLVEYGFRGQGEADPTNPDWSEDPRFVVSQVRSMMELTSEESPRAQIRRAAAGRRALEVAVRRSLPAGVRQEFDHTLSEAQHFTRLRELSKAVWVMSLRCLRPPLLAIGHGLAAAGKLAEPADVRLLMESELRAMAQGGRIADLAERVERRRAEMDEAEQWELPDVFLDEPRPTRRPEVHTVDELVGLGVSVGTARGPVRVIRSTEAAYECDIAPGDVLVAPFTDTPWTPLFIPAAAVVVETGGALSHASTVAREFGIPCVVMVKDATRILCDGDVVQVDGAAGTVRVVTRAAP